MPSRLLLAACLLLAWLAPLARAQGTQTYTFDPEHTRIEFAIRFIGLVPVEGRFTTYEGTLVFDPDRPEASSVTVTIDAASIDTGVERRDRHLRSGDFFEVETYPEITFASSRMESREGRWQAVGTLTMHGVAQEVTIPFTVTDELLYPNTNDVNRGIEARLTLNRVDYGIGSAQAFRQVMQNGSAWASEEVTITLNTMWVRQIPDVADLVAETIASEGLDAGRAQFRALKAAHFGEAVYGFSTNSMRRRGQELIEQGQTDAGLLLLELNTELQPDWPWVYTPLAEAYTALGRTADAIATYRKLLALSPDDTDAAEALKRLMN